MIIPFCENYSEDADFILIEKALNGAEEALTELIERHQSFIYNLVFKMVLSPYDAEDVTQEILIKVITKLSQFNRKSSFRTWLYRITLNHTLNMKKKWLEERYVDFSAIEKDIDSIEDIALTPLEQIEMKELVEEARLGCIAAMLLCLSREQRMVFILGEIFDVPHDFGAELMGISAANFRQRLVRARNDLYQFMNRKCGLINKNNPCRCQKKTKGLIAAGFVDKDTLQFNTAFTKRIREVVSAKDSALKEIEDMTYQQLMQNQPFQEKDFIRKTMKNLFLSQKTLKIFDLEPADFQNQAQHGRVFV